MQVDLGSARADSWLFVCVTDPGSSWCPLSSCSKRQTEAETQRSLLAVALLFYLKMSGVYSPDVLSLIASRSTVQRYRSSRYHEHTHHRFPPLP
jgi:hypothetical protein